MNYSASPQNLHKYNGKEWQPELNLNTYDFGARHYDPVLGRWAAIDPLADKSEGLSAYNYVENNPMNLIDPDGMQPNGGGYQYGFPVGSGSSGGSFGGLGAAGAGLAGANGILQGFAAYKAFGWNSSDPQSFSGLNSVQGNGGPRPQVSGSSTANQGGGTSLAAFKNNVTDLAVWKEIGNDFIFGKDIPGQIKGDLGTNPVSWLVTGPVGEVGTYSEMAKLTKGWKGAIQAHHIVEVRHLKALGLSVSDAPSIILSRLEHANVTKTLRELMPQGRTYTTGQIMDAYKQAYRAFPEWIKSAEKYLGL